MLRRVGAELNSEGAKTTFAKAHFPAPFKEGLEYSSPARGTWNIVHTGMLIPQSHQIFVCAQGCLRGVVLTAAEMCALDRYSAIQIREENVLDGGMEELMIEGVTDIIGKLPYRPRAILLFISCQHFFLAYDQKLVFATLRERFPDIKFVDCYMIPTLRKSGVTPDQKMRIQMYRMWEPISQNLKHGFMESRPEEYKNETVRNLCLQKSMTNSARESCLQKSKFDAMRDFGFWKLENYTTGDVSLPELENSTKKELVSERPMKVNLIGSNLPTNRQSELVQMVESAGYEFWDLYRCRTFDDYMAMAEATLNLVYEPMAIPAAEDLKKRLGQDYLYLTFSFDFDELEENYRRLAERLSIVKPDFSDLKEKALAALASVRALIGDTPVALDYTFTFRILSFARLLLEQGFHVTEIFADAFLPEDEENFKWIKEHFPDIVISATNRPKMRFLYPHENNEENRDSISWKIEKLNKMVFYDNSIGIGDAEASLDVPLQTEAESSLEVDEVVLTEHSKFEQEKYCAKIREKSTSDDLEQKWEDRNVLALGQKAAYFCGTDYFVNVAESGGYYGFQGIIQLAELMKDAFLHKKDRKSLIQKKGFGCESCI